jgi:hypothetical protein
MTDTESDAPVSDAPVSDAPVSDPPVMQRATATTRRPRWLRYALWQSRDYAVERALPSMIVAGLFEFLGVLFVRGAAKTGPGSVPASTIARYGSIEAAHRAMIESTTMLVMRQFIGAIVFLGALFAINGLISNDRKTGYYRFLFAKPVSPERYYGQAFVINGIGYLAAVTLLMLLWGAFVVPILSVDLLAAIGAVYLCYAGITFLLSAVAKWDWLLLVAVALVSTLLWTRYGESTNPAARLLYFLPPLTRVDAVYAAATQHLALPWRLLAWLGGYGLACFAAGLVVLRTRRLATP